MLLTTSPEDIFSFSLLGVQSWDKDKDKKVKGWSSPNSFYSLAWSLPICILGHRILLGRVVLRPRIERLLLLPDAVVLLKILMEAEFCAIPNF